VLVVDDHSKALLESVYKLFDILHMNITGKRGFDMDWHEIAS
jgi:hypothetical protein